MENPEYNSLTDTQVSNLEHQIMKKIQYYKGGSENAKIYQYQWRQFYSLKNQTRLAYVWKSKFCPYFSEKGVKFSNPVSFLLLDFKI